MADLLEWSFECRPGTCDQIVRAGFNPGMKNHRSLPLVSIVLLVALPLGVNAASQKKQTTQRSLSVVDGAGRNLGPVVHIEDPLYDAQGVYQRKGAPIAVDAAFEHDGRTFLLRFLTVEPYLDGTSRVFFESCDCSGDPLIRVEPSGQFGALFTPSAIAASHKLYLARADAGDPQQTAVCSLLTADTGCEPVADGGGSPEESVVPAELVGTLPFTEPYHVEGSGLRDPIAAP
jgi:hypothetical protein